MSEFKIACPNCDQHLACDESYYGLQINCPTCGKLIQLPTKSYCNLVRLAMIDGKLEDSENNFLVEWGRSKGLTDHAIVELFDQAKRESESGLEATRFEDLYTLISLAMIDGYLSVKELNHIIGFGEKLGMNRAQVNAVVSQVRKGEHQPSMAA